MNSLTRALKTINLEIPDRVPVDLHSFAVAAYNTGKPFGEVFKNGKLMAEAQLKLWERFGHDVILLENGTTAMAEAMGCQVAYPDDIPPKVVEPALKRLEDVEKLTLPDPGSTATLPQLLIATRRVVEELGQEVFIMGRADQGPFSLAALVRGIDNFMLDLALGTQKELIHQLLEVCTQAVIRLALAQLEAGAHGTSIGDSLAGPSLISPAMYMEYAFPYEKKVVEAVKAAGGVVALHICGDTTAIVDQMVETGAQILEIDEKTVLPKAKSASQGKCCLLGQVSPTALRNETPAEIERMARRTIEIAGRDGGLILGPGCAMAADTPAANIEALVRTARIYGQYKNMLGGRTNND
ncbi:Uroporphyrinogen decarboxylase (URO-D) [Moorella glycerini]|uniref:Uroporphyrinogen decarboxylase n=1 Tax=Neomoorella stamsii TaxID=1266720 RepID=A0A9X7P5U5_9FIRM|nr:MULTISPECIES: uroporphyrinogen decarboxylase family protein [Moorella]PRR72233.1 Uroporphyrinogen decarboxylase [Moorella stamsii]CEP69534.1 Uroporphyrinogen decarboxylase (URO-D) [Moorella glycerini]